MSQFSQFGRRTNVRRLLDSERSYPERPKRELLSPGKQRELANRFSEQ